MTLRRVQPASRSVESVWVFAAISLIVVVMIVRWALVGAGPSGLALQPYQESTDDLPPMQWVLSQAAIASVPDVLRLRDAQGYWPEAAELEKSDLPPFDTRYLPASLGGYQWIDYDGGAWVDYWGYDSTGRQRRTVILRIIDLHAAYHPHPHPGIDYDPDAFFGLQLWYFPEPQRPYPGERLPEAGWTWLVRPGERLGELSESESI